MLIESIRADEADLREYGLIPIAFEVREMLECLPEHGGLGGLSLRLRQVETPFLKDYDEIWTPSHWPFTFALSRWRVFTATVDGQLVGGATVAWDTHGVEMLEGRKDLAVLWDIRVAPEYRGRGVGSTLFRAAETWASERRCRQLKVETQNINVPACRFYQRMGCTLGAIHRFAYPQLPDEVQLLWFKELTPLP